MSSQPIHEELLTAYALGELASDEAAEVEKHLAGNPEARRTVAEIQQLGRTLRSSKAGQPLPASPALRVAVAERLQPKPMPAPVEAPMSWANLVGVALVLLLMVGVGYVLVTSDGSPRLVADKSNMRSEISEELARKLELLDSLNRFEQDRDFRVSQSDARRLELIARFESLRRETDGRESGVFHTLESVDESSIPFSDDPIVLDPPVETWEELTEREGQSFDYDGDPFGDRSGGGFGGSGEVEFEEQLQSQVARLESDLRGTQSRIGSYRGVTPRPSFSQLGEASTFSDSSYPDTGTTPEQVRQLEQPSAAPFRVREGGRRAETEQIDEMRRAIRRRVDPSGILIDEPQTAPAEEAPPTNRPESGEPEQPEPATLEDQQKANEEIPLTKDQIAGITQHRWRQLEGLVGQTTHGLDQLAQSQEGELAEQLQQLQTEYDETRKFLDTKKWHDEEATEEDLKLLEDTQVQLVESTRRLARVVLSDDVEEREKQLTKEVGDATVLLNRTKETLAKRPALKDRPVESWRRSSVEANASRLMIGDREDLPLQGMQAMVQIDGDRARVLLDCYFENDRDQQLEGNFQLRLPSEASLYYFAFGETKLQAVEGSSEEVNAARKSVREVFYSITAGEASNSLTDIRDMRAATWTEPKEARMVPREKAALAYETIKRRQVDPALVEWSGAGVFSARVFPLAPRQVHRIVVGYDVPLERLGEQLVYKLNIPEYVPDASVSINVATVDGVEATVSPQADKAYDGVNRRFYEFKQPVAREFEVKTNGAGEAIALLGAGDAGLGPFASASFQPALPAEEAVAGSSRAVFLLDTSLSANPDQFNVWLKLLQATLENNRGTLQEFAVLTFNIETAWWQPKFVANTPENVARLKEYCESLALEGATDLSAALSEATGPSWQDGTESPPRCDYFLLSDAAATWGEQHAAMLGRILQDAGPLFCYRTGMTGADVRMLNYLARESGGAVFSVVGEQEIEAASTAHRQRPWQILACQWAGLDDVMLAGRPGTLFAGQRLQLVGRGTPQADAPIVLTLRRGDETLELKTPVEHRIASDLAPRQYGQVAVEGLEELGIQAEMVAIPYARQFRITGQSCSLLMLESEEDYRQFDIKPEDDSQVIRETAAAETIVQKLDEVAETLADPKARFVQWMSRLPQVVPQGFTTSDELTAAIDKLPADAFEVGSASLQVKDRTWESIAESLREPLATREIDYDAIMSEAERRRAADGPQDALKCASSLVELRPGDWVLARDVAFSAMDWGLNRDAYYLLRRVSEARPYEPQTYLAMADALQSLGKHDLALVYYEVALGSTWDPRFGDFPRIAATEYLRLLRSMESGQTPTALQDYVATRLPQIEERVQLSESDIVVIVMWNTNDTDVDLHVIEPNGEECYYSHQRTLQGGHLSSDVTQGYGPEMYTLPTAGRGAYQVRAHFYSSDRNRLSARTRAIVKVYENWGADNETLLRRTFTLGGQGDVHEIHKIERTTGPKPPKYEAPKEEAPFPAVE